MFKITNIHVILVALALSGYGYITWQNNKIETLQNNFEQVKNVAEEQGKAIDKLSQDYANIKVYDDERKANKEATDKSDAKMKKDAGREKTVLAKPKLVEKQINTSFDKFAQDLQEATR